MKQYFQENFNLPDNEVQISLEKFGHNFTFFTKRGLFSYNKVDAKSLVLVENMPAIEGRLLDLGCGFGAVGIMLAKMYNVNLTGCDINRIALCMAKKNAAVNGVGARFFHSDCFDGIRGCFESIVLNPPIHAGKEVVYKMYEQAKEHLAPGGCFYIVIQKKHGAKSSLQKLKEIYEVCVTLYKKKGTYVIMASKA